MGTNSDFLMWGERGLVATFFADLYQAARASRMETFNHFLRAADFPASIWEGTDPPEEARFVIEPDFGNAGFGHPDAIFSLASAKGQIVVIVEAKRTDFEHACWSSSRRGEEQFNSRLNGPVELDYCLALALSRFTPDNPYLVEPEWILSTPYNKERKGKIRRLQNPNVLRDVVPLFSGERFDHYYYLIVTTDRESPLANLKAHLRPELFVPEGSGVTTSYTDCWMGLRSHFGWLNYDKMRDLIEKIKGQLPLGSLFLPVYALNKGNMGSRLSVDDDDDGGTDSPGAKIPPKRSTVRPELSGMPLEPPPAGVWGVWIVKFGDKKCQLSCQGFSYALMHLRNRRWDELDRGVKDRERMQKILSRVEILGKAPKVGRDDISFWEDFFKDP